jgi:PEP-CTERM motif
MKKFIGLFVLVSLLASAAQASTIFDYSFTGTDGDVVKGSFSGTANGNLITNLSNITASLNGAVFSGSGNLFGSSFNSAISNWQSGGAVASFNGLQNNFLFINTDYPKNTSFSNYFYSVSNIHNSYAQINSPYNVTSGTTSAANWRVVAATVPEPSSLILFALGLAALVYFRRKQA